MIETCIYTLEQLQARLAYWQRVLRLQDWDVTVDIVPLAQMGGHHYGEITMYALLKRAVIRILSAVDYEAAAGAAAFARPLDMEYTLIHELMHLSIFLCSKKYDVNSNEELFEEQAVHALALAFLSLSRFRVLRPRPAASRKC